MKSFLKGLSRFYFSLILLGVILAGMSFSHVVVSFRPPVSFDELVNGAEVKTGSHVEGELTACLPPFASQTTTQAYYGTAVGAPSSRSFYLVPVTGGFLGLKAFEIQTEAMDALVRETAAYLGGTGEITSVVSVEGVVRPMGKELAGYFREYLQEVGYSDKELDAMGEPMFIEATDFGASRILFNGGIGLFLLAVLLVHLRSRKLMRREREEAALPPAPVQ